MGVFLRLVCLIAGAVLALMVLDELGAVRFLAALAGTDAAMATVSFGYAFVAMLFAGAALSLPAPRAASVVFLLAGGVGLLIGGSTIWENAIVWGIGAFLLAALDYVGYRIKRGKDRKKIQQLVDEQVRANASMSGGSA